MCSMYDVYFGWMHLLVKYVRYFETTTTKAAFVESKKFSTTILLSFYLSHANFKKSKRTYCILRRITMLNCASNWENFKIYYGGNLFERKICLVTTRRHGISMHVTSGSGHKQIWLNPPYFCRQENNKNCLY
jgi:hypothetical protein